LFIWQRTGKDENEKTPSSNLGLPTMTGATITKSASGIKWMDPIEPGSQASTPRAVPPSQWSTWLMSSST